MDRNRRTSPHNTPLFLLAGQSNMEGMGFNRELPLEIRGRQKGGFIYSPNRVKDHQNPDEYGVWAPLEPGHGYGVRQERRGVILSDRFGPELSFGNTLQRRFPMQPIALFKYAKGGSSLHPATPDDWGHWDVETAERGGENQWSHFCHHYRLAVRRWERASELASYEQRKDRELSAGRPAYADMSAGPLEPSAFIWIQGESDAAYSREIASTYGERLQHLISAVRELTGKPRLPVVLATLSDSGMEGRKPSLPWAETVRRAQADTAYRDPYVRLVAPPEGHGWTDPWHYDSETYIKLGRRIGEVIHLPFS